MEIVILHREFFRIDSEEDDGSYYFGIRVPRGGFWGISSEEIQEILIFFVAVVAGFYDDLFFTVT